MKNIFILLLIVFTFVSCWKTDEETVVEETGRIVNEYVDTLEWSIGDAKDVKALIEWNQEKLKDNLRVQ